MFYDYPKITHVDQVREAIRGRDEFIEADKGDYLVFNYLVNFEDTFPPVTDERTAILRECRGLIFDKETGQVTGRRYHKFFNMNEKAETRREKVDWTQPHVVLEKLDGSMVTPFAVKVSGKNSYDVRLGTKMGETDVARNADAFIDEHPEYGRFILDQVYEGFTPIFEWCSRKNRIVVDYPEDRLVLTAIRANVTGYYVWYESMVAIAESYGIEYVKVLTGDLESALGSLNEIEDEGYVVRFWSGHMLKLKGSHYLKLHKTLEHVQHEKDLIRLIVDEKLDDAKPFLPEDLVKKLDDFGAEFFRNVSQLADTMAWEIIEDYDRTSGKKAYAALIADKSETKVRFQGYDFLDGSEYGNETVAFLCDFIRNKLLERIKNNLSTGPRVDTVRHLFGGLRWQP